MCPAACAPDRPCPPRPGPMRGPAELHASHRTQLTGRATAAGRRSSGLAATDTAGRDSGGNARTFDQPTPRVPGTADGCAAPSRQHKNNSLPASAGRGVNGGSSRSAQSQPRHLALTGSRPGTGPSARVQDQPATTTTSVTTPFTTATDGLAYRTAGTRAVTAGRAQLMPACEWTRMSAGVSEMEPWRDRPGQLG